MTYPNLFLTDFTTSTQLRTTTAVIMKICEIILRNKDVGYHCGGQSMKADSFGSVLW